MNKQNDSKKMVTTTVPAVLMIIAGLVFGVKWLVVVGIALIVIPIIILGSLFVFALIVNKVANNNK